MSEPTDIKGRDRSPKAPRKPFPQRYTDEPDVAGSSSSATPLLDNYEDDPRADDDEELPGYVEHLDGDYGDVARVVNGAGAAGPGAAGPGFPGAGAGAGGAGGDIGGGDGPDAPPDFEDYRPVVKKIKTRLGMGDTLVVSHDKHLNTDGEALYRWVKSIALVFSFSFFFFFALSYEDDAVRQVYMLCVCVYSFYDWLLNSPGNEPFCFD